MRYRRKAIPSFNIKERLDFACAVFDNRGDLVANAPHVPVHLGSMSESVKTVIRENGASMRPGSVYMLNAPYDGGTHLPDVTVITPVFDEVGRNILCRNIEQNIADLAAQIAASETGVSELRKMVRQFGLEVVQAYMKHVQNSAEESVWPVLDRLQDGRFVNRLDGGIKRLLKGV